MKINIKIKPFFTFTENSFSAIKNIEAQQMLLNLYYNFLEKDYDNLRSTPIIKDFEITVDATLDTNGTYDLLMQEAGQHRFVFYNSQDDKNYVLHLDVYVDDKFEIRDVRKYQFSKFGNYIYEMKKLNLACDGQFTFKDSEIEDFLGGNLTLLKNKAKK